MQFCQSRTSTTSNEFHVVHVFTWKGRNKTLL